MILSNRKTQGPHDETERMQSKKLWISLGSIAGLLSLGWFVLAFKSGTFIRDDSRYVVSPGDFTHDTMAGRKQIIDLGNYKVAYIDEGKGEPVILLHGCPFSVYEWHDVVPLLASHFRVIAPDLLGLGDTPVRLNDDYRLSQDVSMVIELMDRLGFHSARFIGHDHGGAIIQLLMEHDPSRIEMAVVTNAEAYDQWPSKPETGDLHLITNPFTSPLVFFALHSRRVQRDLYSIAVVNKSSLTDETLGAFASEHLASARRWQRLRRFFASQLDPANNGLTKDAVPSMRRFTRPVLILWGEKDTNFGPSIANRLARDIPGVVGVSWLTNSAHLPMLEEPQKYADIVTRFFSDGTVTKTPERHSPMPGGDFHGTRELQPRRPKSKLSGSVTGAHTMNHFQVLTGGILFGLASALLMPMPATQAQSVSGLHVGNALPDVIGQNLSGSPTHLSSNTQYAIKVLGGDQCVPVGVLLLARLAGIWPAGWRAVEVTFLV